jgi:transcriptional adapter 2-alpha
LQVRIQCVPCADYDLCVPCFSEGKSSRDHEPATHPFRVIEQHSIPIFTDDWGADEELLLLEGAETYGLGSWAEIADHIGGCRSKDEVRDHYIKTYIESDNFPLPEHARPDDRTLIDRIPREEFQARKKQRIEERKEAAKNALPAPPKTKPTASVPSCHEVAGYMPGRLEFETEYFNEAEEAVQHMQFESGDAFKLGDDPDPEVELKMTMMEIYNGRLVARVERKKIIFEHQLLEYRKLTGADKKRTKEERELMNRTKPFARMMNHDDFATFCEDIEYECNLRQAIAQLQEWRINQITDLKAGEKYEAEKLQRAQRGNQFVDLSRLTARALTKNALQEGPTAASSFVSPDLVLKPFNGLNTPPPSDSEGPMANGYSNGLADGAQPSTMGEKFVIPPLPGMTPLNFERDQVEDLHLLTDEEREICRILRIYPKPYTVLKESVIQEALRSGGYLKKKTMRDICKIDSTKASRLFDFWVHCGWIGRAER